MNDDIYLKVGMKIGVLLRWYRCHGTITGFFFISQINASLLIQSFSTKLRWETNCWTHQKPPFPPLPPPPPPQIHRNSTKHFLPQPSFHPPHNIPNAWMQFNDGRWWMDGGMLLWLLMLFHFLMSSSRSLWLLFLSSEYCVTLKKWCFIFFISFSRIRPYT